ncbi:MAG: hypothetical protein JEZ02_17130 [Desulfatibacillum sp.]|nr:hypothetical protein [Desulfatibacillum sp.]
MIIVSGTYRTGTSLMMQIMEEAGFDVLGEKFPKAWKGTNNHLNKEGFYESRWIDKGVNKENCQLAPKATQLKACKVFTHGLATTDIEFMDKVVLMTRDWREQQRSATILDETNRSSHGKKPVGYYPPGQVFLVNYAKFLADFSKRKYPAIVVDFNDLISQPQKTCQRIRNFLGAGRFDLAAQRIKPKLKTVDERGKEWQEPFHLFMDRFYKKLKTGHLEATFLKEAQVWINKVSPEIQKYNELRKEDEEAGKVPEVQGNDAESSGQEPASSAA